jgi:hypothetical protein
LKSLVVTLMGQCRQFIEKKRDSSIITGTQAARA